MAWYTGKTALSVLAWGDSNMFGSGGFTPPGGQVTTTGLWCYASATGQVPYTEANLGWRNALDPNGTNRLPEYNSYFNDGPYATASYIGQVLGGNGNPAMGCGQVLKEGTTIDTYVYHSAVGGTTAAYWQSGNGWTTLERTVPAALASIPGAPTAFDCILASIGGNDAIQGVPQETFVTNMKAIRSQMIAEGWWVPGVTQFVILDMPRSGYFWDNFGTWQGVELVRARFNDRINRTNATGYEFADGIHYLPPYYTNAAEQAGDMFIAQVPKQKATFTIGGVRLSLGGEKLRVNSA